MRVVCISHENDDAAYIQANVMYAAVVGFDVTPLLCLIMSMAHARGPGLSFLLPTSTEYCFRRVAGANAT